MTFEMHWAGERWRKFLERCPCPRQGWRGGGRGAEGPQERSLRGAGGRSPRTGTRLPLAAPLALAWGAGAGAGRGSLRAAQGSQQLQLGPWLRAGAELSQVPASSHASRCRSASAGRELSDQPQGGFSPLPGPSGVAALRALAGRPRGPVPGGGRRGKSRRPVPSSSCCLEQGKGSPFGSGAARSREVTKI